MLALKSYNDNLITITHNNIKLIVGNYGLFMGLENGNNGNGNGNDSNINDSWFNLK